MFLNILIAQVIALTLAGDPFEQLYILPVTEPQAAMTSKRHFAIVGQRTCQFCVNTNDSEASSLFGFDGSGKQKDNGTVANSGLDIISKSQVAGQTVRQCSCDEQRICVEEMKAQAKDCTVPCFSKFNKITKRPQDLRKCFEEKDDILQSFLNCFEERVEACVDNMHGPQIPKADIASIFAIGEKKIAYQSATIQNVIAPIRDVVDAAGDFAKCVKDCFIQKNTNGFCFDKKGCLPLLVAKKAKNSFRHCTRKMNWKREAGELCECSVDAGVTVLRQYCSMFSLMGRKKPAGRN